jgi:hypothetical protein
VRSFPMQFFFCEKFSYAVVVVGEVSYAEGAGYRTDLSIPFDGSTLITRVASKIPTLVIVISGRPLLIEPQVLDKIDALVAAWLPGSARALGLPIASLEIMISLAHCL